MFQQRTRSLLLAVTALFAQQNKNDGFVVNGFTASPCGKPSSSVRSSLHNMVTTSAGDYFFDDFHRNNNNNDDDSSTSSSSYRSQNLQQQQQEQSKSKFVSGDELHRLRHQVLALRLELQEARRNLNQFTLTNDDEDSHDFTATTNKNDDEVEYRHTRLYHQQRVHELEQAIMKTQQVDAEFVYTVSLERQELAEKEGNLLEASRFHQAAMEARSALPQFNLEGLWVGKYSEDGYEMINVTYQGDVLLAEKVTGTKNVPKGQATFQVDLSPKGEVLGMFGTAAPTTTSDQQQQVLSPIELGDSAAKQWGCRYLPRFAGKGQVAAEGYQDSQWIDGQLIMVNEYFSFAWLPIGHQVFFGRPTPELILKLMKDEKKKEVGDCSARAFLEKCWEETEHIADDLEITNDASMMDSSPDRSYYYEDGCFQ